MNKLVLLLALISTVFAQKPVPCTTPAQWEARLFQYDVSQRFQMRAHVTYDAIYFRERVVDEQVLGRDDEAFDTLSLYGLKVQYVYSFKTRTCKKQPLTTPWRNFGVPANATSLGESFIGSSAVPNANVLSTVWAANYTDASGNRINYWGVWTLNACLPVSAVYYNDQFGLLHSNVFDITPGISDPNAFIPRPECL